MMCHYLNVQFQGQRVKQRRVLIAHRRFGKTYRLYLQESGNPWRLLNLWRWDR